MEHSTRWTVAAWAALAICIAAVAVALNGWSGFMWPAGVVALAWFLQARNDERDRAIDRKLSERSPDEPR